MSRRSSQQKSVTISGIILAAGQSTRMGQPKQLLPFKGKPMLQTVIDCALGSLLNEVIVVIGHDKELIQEQIDFSHVNLVVNENFNDGQSSSIRAGLSQVSVAQQAALFLLADQPFIRSTLINAIVEYYQQTQAPIVMPVINGRQGNPVLFDRHVFQELMTIKGDRGGRVLFDRHRSEIASLEVSDKSILLDVDSPEDYEQLLRNA